MVPGVVLGILPRERQGDFKDGPEIFGVKQQFGCLSHCLRYPIVGKWFGSEHSVFNMDMVSSRCFGTLIQ